MTWLEPPAIAVLLSHEPDWTGDPSDEASMTEHGADLIEKLRSIRVSRRGFASGAAATLAASHGWSARAQDSTPVANADETFDADGATLRVASWGGFWQEVERT